MPKLLNTLPLIAFLALSQGVNAQDTTTPQPAEGAEATTPAAEGSETEQKTDGIGDNLSLGEENQPTVLEPYVKEEHGDWKLQCFPVAEGEETCQLYQLLKDKQGTDVAEVAIFRLPAGGKAAAGATVTVPLETLLTAQLAISVDGGKGKRYPFSFCTPIGCIARIGFTAQDIASFKNGAAATLTLVPAPAPDQKVELKMSLSGFTKGYDAASIVKN